MTPDTQPFFVWHLTLGDILMLLFIGIPAIFGVVKIFLVLSDYVPHKHIEEKGQLHKEGISYPRGMKDR